MNSVTSLVTYKLTKMEKLNGVKLYAWCTLKAYSIKWDQSYKQSEHLGKRHPYMPPSTSESQGIHKDTHPFLFSSSSENRKKEKEKKRQTVHTKEAFSLSLTVHCMQEDKSILDACQERNLKAASLGKSKIIRVNIQCCLCYLSCLIGCYAIGWPINTQSTGH